MESTRILITGGAGFIGSNLADHFLRLGHTVTLFDNLSRQGVRHNLDWLVNTYGDRLCFIQGDVRDEQAILQAARGQQVIYHTAGQTAVTTSVTNPREDFTVNAVGTFNVLEAARLCGEDPVVIYTSTNKVYGGMEDVRVQEDARRYDFADCPLGMAETRPLDFHSPYGCSKGAADQYVRDYARIYGLRTVVFRMSSIYGPHQFGMEDQAWVAYFVIAAVKGWPLTIYGDGKQVRDILFVSDLARAFEAATENIAVTAGQVYNIGGGPHNTVSIWTEFAPLLAGILGHPIDQVAYGSWRPGDQKVYISDIRKAASGFGWAPQVSVEAGIAQITAWVVQNQDLFAR